MRVFPVVLAAAGAISLLATAAPAKADRDPNWHPGWRDHHVWEPGYYRPARPGYYRYGYAYPTVRYGYPHPVVRVRPPAVVVRP
jgi:hypothetical protein